MDKKKQYRGVVFDLDGTLVNSLEDLADSMNKVLALRNFPIHPVESYKYHVGDGLKNLVIRTLPPAYKSNDELIETCMGEMRKIYDENWNRKSRLYEGIPELLTSLTDLSVKLAICSNKPDNFTKDFYNYFLAEWNFASVIGARKDLPLKPDPSGTILSAENLSIPTHNILYLGDTATDMITATRAGMTAVGVLWGFRNKKELIENGAAAIINHPLELMAFFM